MDPNWLDDVLKLTERQLLARQRQVAGDIQKRKMDDGEQHPRSVKPRARVKQAHAQHPQVPQGASILIVKKQWLDLILDGEKTMEIRGRLCRKEPSTIFLAQSAAGGKIMGSVYLHGSSDPLSSAEWKALRAQHRVPGPRMYKRTYAWRLSSAYRFPNPIPYTHKQGSVVWAKM